MTDIVGMHWATGQSAFEDANLAALLAWIDPPQGQTGAEAAMAAEDPSIWPPAGPSTDPDFDNLVLAPAIAAYASAAQRWDDPLAETRAYEAIKAAVETQLMPTWRLMWRGVALLRAMPPGDRVADRWMADRDVFTDVATSMAEGGSPPQPRRDGAVAAARRLQRLERAQAAYVVQRAYDDALIMAEYRLRGEAFVATVTEVDRLRIDTSGRRRVLRPWITLETADVAVPEVGSKWASPARPSQRGIVVEVVAGQGSWQGPASGRASGPASGTASGPASGRATGTGPVLGPTVIVLELSGGMGRGLTPPAGSVPSAGERLCYTSLADDFIPAGVFCDPEDTPWTHGGPQRTTAGDAAEGNVSGGAAGDAAAGRGTDADADAGEEWS